MAAPAPPRAALLRDHNFKWLLRGGVVSMLGDQLTLIALPWLVFRLTGDTVALGLVIALMSIPRAVFMLVGGALVDRHSPKRVLMLSKYANAALLPMLTLLVLDHQPAHTLALGGALSLTVVMTPHLTLMAIYALAFCIGLAQAFGLDCLSFLLSAWTLSKVRLPPASAGSAEPDAAPVLRAVGAGLAMVWRDVPLRTCFIYWGAVSLLIGGTMQVALPVLAATLHGASTLGLLMGAHGAGTLLGMGAAAVGGARLRRIGAGISFGTLIVLIDGAVGLLVMQLGAVGAAWQAALLMLAIGVLAGFMQINVFTWIQQRVPAHMMGRAMSIFMFIFMGLAPLSAGATGWLLTVMPLSQLFVGGGMILVLCAALAYGFTPMRRITANAR